MRSARELCRLGTSVAKRGFGDTKHKSLTVKWLELSPDGRAANRTRIGRIDADHENAAGTLRRAARSALRRG